MKRLPIHLMFGVATLCCVGVAGYYAVRLQHVAQANAAIAAIGTQPREQWSKSAADSNAPAVRLAQADRQQRGDEADP